jgi:uncharacterized protein YcbX
MLTEIGHIEAIFRYPVKSMRGESLDIANLGWDGIEGDRRLAFRRVNDRSAFPWLSASKLPEMILFTPQRSELLAQGASPVCVRTPDGKDLAVFGNELAAEVASRCGSPVQMMEMKHGIFDEANISVIALDTIQEIAQLVGLPLEPRRFRPNIAVRLRQPGAFQEDEWLGDVLSFGDAGDAPAIAVTMRDLRCSMVNLDPDSARSSPEVLKTIVRVNDNHAGIYGTVTRTGQVRVGQKVFRRCMV